MYFITLEKKDDFLFNLKQVIKSIFKATILLPALATMALVLLSTLKKNRLLLKPPILFGVYTSV